MFCCGQVVVSNRVVVGHGVASYDASCGDLIWLPVEELVLRARGVGQYLAAHVEELVAYLQSAEAQASGELAGEDGTSIRVPPRRRDDALRFCNVGEVSR